MFNNKRESVDPTKLSTSCVFCYTAVYRPDLRQPLQAKTTGTAKKRLEVCLTAYEVPIASDVRYLEGTNSFVQARNTHIRRACQP
jgi:hypothetical protein